MLQMLFVNAIDEPVFQSKWEYFQEFCQRQTKNGNDEDVNLSGRGRLKCKSYFNHEQCSTEMPNNN